MNFQNIYHKFYLNCVQLTPLTLNESTEFVKFTCHNQIPDEIVSQICDRDFVSYTKCIEKLVYNFKGNPYILNCFVKTLNEILEKVDVTLNDIQEMEMTLPSKYESYLKEEKNLLIYCQTKQKSDNAKGENNVATNSIIVCFKNLKSRKNKEKIPQKKVSKQRKSIFDSSHKK